MSDKKGYWIAHVSVSDPDKYENYKAAAPKAFAEYGAQYIVRGGDFQQMEGDTPGQRHVIIEFPSYQAAIDCYNSDLYQRARDERIGAGLANITIVEGA